MELIFSIPHEVISPPSYFEMIVKYLPSATPIIALLAALVAFFGYRRQRRLHQEKLSFDFVHFYQNDKELAQHKNNLNTLFKKFRRENIDVASFAHIDSESEYGKSIMAVLNTWERCAHSIKEELIDEEYLYNIFHVVALKAYDLLEGYIDSRRSLKGNSTAYINFRWLVQRWKLRALIDPPKEDFTELKKLITKSSDYNWAFKKGYRLTDDKYKKKNLKRLYKNLTQENRKKGISNWIKSILSQN
ncbi:MULTISPECIES: DUF4760 domain-containing protein [Enterobacteriaceae]|uniref:DUF4760 domain-containing protein n=1 Tax=Enterobacteriaceae TaxID=543 RepID=UPI0012FD82DF|nr:MULTISPECIES: DUF4760 domain-containing protein [Enterobacteriaceae]HBQ3221557.1 DUF4760 domain-containing protein [Klebsiella aerogenes]EFO4388242.1 DUF4760 domain-containing protein [Escherichia coli]EGI2341407.1 DUF4760 domain-containing protein [Escherichia coli]MBC5379941.1 DUF4760 domain-containing protein [Klebsiella variicola]MCQ0121788.1 DUF4760 domain-containing protein [Escherichia coli]